MSTGWNLKHTYSELPEIFHSRVLPTPVSQPQVVVLNLPVAQSLGLNFESLQREAAQVLSGNTLPMGAQPIAQAYAGHQYGHFTMLGDGRAILLGEQMDPEGACRDIQLKGSGETPYSRRGDGRATLGPMLREYLISEAMFALGIPTTRSLAVVATGEPVIRDTVLPGAILTRVAASHIRVGTFEFAATRGLAAVRSLADYVMKRHFPESMGTERPYETLLKQVVQRQARLIAAWMNVGFVHGVMNSDNMTISGETIDYGPCAFMDRYDPATVFSSIDRHGRYAYANQPAIAHWNLTRLAEALLPLLNPNEDSAVEIAKSILDDFGKEFSEAWKAGMRSKLGLFESRPEDESLIEDLLTWMQASKADFTNTFRALTLYKKGGKTEPVFDEWLRRWQQRQAFEGRSIGDSLARMCQSNPNLIPRNHQVENALSAAVDSADLAPFTDLLGALQTPFEDRPEHQPFLEPATDGGEGYQTFCGT